MSSAQEYGNPQPPGQAQGPDLKAQLRTAITHAGFAAGGSAQGYIEQHLGHALNCLEGPRGKNFNQRWGNVCQGQGNGILTDLKAAPGGGDFTLVAEQADALAAAGTKSKNLNEAKIAAKGVGALLSVIADNMK
ncbi:MAG: hypothetical protein ACT4P5_08430 [Armatimonadota bacterium]